MWKLQTAYSLKMPVLFIAGAVKVSLSETASLMVLLKGTQFSNLVKVGEIELLYLISRSAAEELSPAVQEILPTTQIPYFQTRRELHHLRP